MYYYFNIFKQNTINIDKLIKTETEMNVNLVKCVILGLFFTTYTFAQNSVTTIEEVVNSDKYKVETNRFWNNWFIGAGIGGQVYFGKNDDKLSFSNRITPNYNINLGKWFTPGIGLRLGFDRSDGKGLTTNANTGNATWAYEDFYTTDFDNPLTIDGVNYYRQTYNYGHLNANVLFNVSNMVWGYNPERLYSFVPYAGFGLLWSKGQNRAGVSASKVAREHEFSAVAGILNSFRISKAFDLTLDIKGSLLSSHFSHKKSIDVNEPGSKDYILSASLGVVYNIKPGWDRARTITKTIKYSEEELNTLRNRVNELAKANQDLSDQLSNMSKESQIEYEKTIVSAPLLITFPINKSTLSKEARVNLGFLAKFIKENPDMIYVITGYADKGTGTKNINESLSKARSQVVYDCLVNEFGVSPSQFRTAYEGGVDDMFYNDPRLSRAVITKLMK